MAWSLSDIRFGQDGASSVSWSAACNTSKTGWDKSNKLIVSAYVTTNDHSPGSKSMKLRWRNKTDNPSGSFADFVTGSGELRAGASAGALSNGTTVTTAAGCRPAAYSEEMENESPLQSQSFSPAKSDYIEMQWCIDMSNAHDADEYEFELWDVTGSASLGISSYTVTIQAGLTHYTLEVLSGSFAFAGQDVILKATRKLVLSSGSFAFAGQDVTLSRTRELVAASGAFSFAGQDVTLKADRKIIPAAGAFPFAGQDVNFYKGYNFVVNPGSFPFSGKDATLKATRKIVPESGAFVFNGQNARLYYHRKFSVDTANCPFGGSDTNLLKGYLIVPGVGAFPFAGQDVDLIKSGAYTIEVLPGAFAFNGSDVTLTYTPVSAPAVAAEEGHAYLKRKPKIGIYQQVMEEDREILQIVKQIIASGILD